MQTIRQLDKMNRLNMSSPINDLLIAATKASDKLRKSLLFFNNQIVRGLCDELQSLSQSFERLNRIAKDEDPIVSMLKSLVLCCEKSCREFDIIFVERTSSSIGGPRSIFKNWDIIRYMDGNIEDFQNMVSNYKCVLAIAFNSLNKQDTEAAFENTEAYTEIIETRVKLKTHNQQINRKLDLISSDKSKKIKQFQECISLCNSITHSLRAPYKGCLPTDAEPEKSTITAVNKAANIINIQATELQNQLYTLLKQPSNIEVSEKLCQSDHIRLLKEADIIRCCFQVCELALQRLW
ncbi:hypothetical protein GGI35DRAFT_465478 [Trichoderma velutinum]